MSVSHYQNTRLGGLRARPKACPQLAVLLHRLVVLVASRRLESQEQMEEGAERTRSALPSTWRETIMRISSRQANNHLHLALAKTSTEQVPQPSNGRRQQPASTRRTVAARLQRKRTRTTLSGLPHPWKCSEHLATPVLSASTPSKTTMTSAV
jgi:hypothetical protein